MKRFVLCSSLALCCAISPVAAVAKTTTNPDLRSAEKAAKKQQKEMTKYNKTQKKTLKQAQKDQENQLKHLSARH